MALFLVSQEKRDPFRDKKGRWKSWTKGILTRYSAGGRGGGDASIFASWEEGLVRKKKISYSTRSRGARKRRKKKAHFMKERGGLKTQKKRIFLFWTREKYPGGERKGKGDNFLAGRSRLVVPFHRDQKKKEKGEEVFFHSVRKSGVVAEKGRCVIKNLC